MTDSHDKGPPNTGKTNRKPPYKKPPRKQGVTQVSTLTRAVLTPLVQRYGAAYVDVLLNWKTIVGTQLSALTTVQELRFPPKSHSCGTLHIHCIASAIPLITMQSPQIIARVNVYFGYQAVIKLQCKSGLTIPRQPLKKEPPVLRARDKEYIDTLAETVHHDALRDALTRLGEGIFTAQRNPRA